MYLDKHNVFPVSLLNEVPPSALNTQVPKCVNWPSDQVSFKCLSASSVQVCKCLKWLQMLKWPSSIVSECPSPRGAEVSKCHSVTQMLLVFQVPYVSKCLIVYSIIFILYSVIFLFCHWNVQSDLNKYCVEKNERGEYQFGVF